MKPRCRRIALSACLLIGCAASSSSSPGSSAPDQSTSSDTPEDPFEDDSFEYEGSLVQEIVECQLWDEPCLSRVQDIRHQQQTETKLDELRKEIEQTRREQHEQHEQQLRAINRAAGKDPDAGRGFWCFTGRSKDRSLTECRRTWDQCADRILRREREGLTVKDRRCEEYAQAACFRLTRTLKQGERVMCYGDMASCEAMQGSVGSEGFAVPPTACSITE